MNLSGGKSSWIIPSHFKLIRSILRIGVTYPEFIPDRILKDDGESAPEGLLLKVWRIVKNDGFFSGLFSFRLRSRGF